MPTRAPKRSFTLRGGYDSVSISKEDLKKVDSEYNGKDLVWTRDKPAVSLPATTSEAVLQELHSQSGLIAGDAPTEES